MDQQSNVKEVLGIILLITEPKVCLTGKMWLHTVLTSVSYGTCLIF